ncbi:MAG: ABC transporter ATP-binding protein [Dehalococcoidia bacterium]|nr:ABC transporter ATP-binding protein [Dehalococcoidia bacterium]
MATSIDARPLVVDCQDLFKIYKRADLEVVALRGLDLQVAQGEFIAVVGTSGSGKSTFLNILAGLDRPSAGRVLVGARDLLTMNEKELVSYRRQEVGFVWQAVTRNLLPYLTAEDNVSLPMAIQGVDESERRKRAGELLTTLGLGTKKNRYPNQLSGGEQQRVAIAVGLANNPPLILADEPTGELDTQTAINVFDGLRTITERYGTTVVVVTHYPGIARHVDRVVQIRDGRLSTEVVMRPTFRGGDAVLEEYVLVDAVGRLQLPEEQLERLHAQGRVTIETQGDRIIIRAVGYAGGTHE